MAHSNNSSEIAKLYLEMMIAAERQGDSRLVEMIRERLRRLGSDWTRNECSAQIIYLFSDASAQAAQPAEAPDRLWLAVLQAIVLIPGGLWLLLHGFCLWLNHLACKV